MKTTDPKNRESGISVRPTRIAKTKSTSVGFGKRFYLVIPRPLWVGFKAISMAFWLETDGVWGERPPCQTDEITRVIWAVGQPKLDPWLLTNTCTSTSILLTVGIKWIYFPSEGRANHSTSRTSQYMTNVQRRDVLGRGRVPL